MENKVLFLKVRPHFKCGAEVGTAMLIGSGISALGGLGSGILGSSSASSNNAAALAFNKWSQLQAQDYNTKMYERQLADQEALYNKYQSPQAIAEQLAKAGINPSALAAKSGFSGGSMPSVPSAGSASPLSAPALQNTGAPLGEAIQQTASAISSLTSSYASFAQGKDTIDTLDHRIKLLISQQEGQDLLNAYQSTQNFIQEEFGHDKAGAELQEIHSRIFANYCTGHLAEADEECKDMMTKLYQQQWDMNDEQRGALLGKAYAEWQLVNSKIETEKEAAKTQKSQQALNYGSAEQARQNAKQIELQNKILGNPGYRQSVLSQTTLEAKNALDRHNISQEQFSLLKEQIELAKKENDIYKLREIMGIINETISSFGSAAGEVGRTIIAARFMRGMPAGPQIITSAPNQTILPNGQIVTNSFQQVHW